MAHTAASYVRGEKGSSAAALPVFSLLDVNNLEAQDQDHALKERPHHHSLPANTSFNHKSTLLDTSTDYYGCGGRRSTKPARNISAPKSRPPAAASILNEASTRVHSMRILSTPKTEGSPLDWRDDTHYSHSHQKQGIVSDAHVGARPWPSSVKSSMDSSIDFSRAFPQELPFRKGFSQEFPATKGFLQEFPSKKGFSQEFPYSKNKPSARQQSPSSSNKTKAGFKYLSAKLVAEKLVKALTKDKGLQGGTTKKPDSLTQVQKRARNLAATNSKLNAPQPNQSIDLQTDEPLSPLDGHFLDVNGGNGHPGSPPRASLESEFPELHAQDSKFPSYETRLATLHSEILDPASEKHSSYNVRYPLEAQARAFEEQAALYSSGNELSDVLTRTLVDDGDCEYDTLEIHMDVLQKEFRKHMEDKRELALKMAAELRARLSERIRAEEMLMKAKAEMEIKVRMLEREKVEMKSGLREDMEESETQWASKYEKMKAKEKRLNERLKEILEEKVELHKEVSSLTTKKNALVEEIQGCKESMQTLKERADESTQEVAKLRKALENSVAQSSSMRAFEGSADKVLEGSMDKLTEDEINTLARRYKHKEKEVSRLQKLCKEQEKTIAGLRIALGEQANNAQLGKGEFIVKLQRELVRLTGIEQGLRKEVDACKGEALAARRENVSLIERLSSIMKRLGGAGSRVADANEDLEHAQREIRPVDHISNREVDKTCATRLEEIRDEREAELHSNDNSMAIVLLGHPPPATLHTLNDIDGQYPRLGHVCDFIASGLESQCKDGEELEKLRDEVQNLIKTKARLQEEASNLHNALSLTNRRVRELEAQVE